MKPLFVFLFLFAFLALACPYGEPTFAQSLTNPSTIKSFNLSNYGIRSALRSLHYATPHISGTGTSTDPYLLYDAADFDSIRYLGFSSDKYYKLVNDIDLTAFSPWSPFGTSHTAGFRFEAKLDGNNKTIKNLSPNPLLDYPSLLGIVNGITVTNLTLVNTTLNFTGVNPRQYAGVLIARNYAAPCTLKFISITGVNIDYRPTNTITSFFFGSFGQNGNNLSIIQDCHISNFNADIRVGTSSGNFVGGFVSSGTFSFTRCSIVGVLNTERINTNTQSGCLFAGGNLLTGSSLTDCFARGEIKTSETYPTATIDMSGISRYRVSMSRCYSAVIVDNGSTSSNQSSFIVDYNTGSGTITNCYYDNTLYNRDGVVGGSGATAKTTTELQTQSTFTGWDFTNTWSIDVLKNNGYPYLK